MVEERYSICIARTRSCVFGQTIDQTQSSNQSSNQRQHSILLSHMTNTGERLFVGYTQRSFHEDLQERLLVVDLLQFLQFLQFLQPCSARKLSIERTMTPPIRTPQAMMLMSKCWWSAQRSFDISKSNLESTEGIPRFQYSILWNWLEWTKMMQLSRVTMMKPHHLKNVNMNLRGTWMIHCSSVEDLATWGYR